MIIHSCVHHLFKSTSTYLILEIIEALYKTIHGPANFTCMLLRMVTWVSFYNLHRDGN